MILNQFLSITKSIYVNQIIDLPSSLYSQNESKDFSDICFLFLFYPDSCNTKQTIQLFPRFFKLNTYTIILIKLDKISLRATSRSSVQLALKIYNYVMCDPDNDMIRVKSSGEIILK